VLIPALSHFLLRDAAPRGVAHTLAPHGGASVSS
jgi:hypothetical protein